MDNDMLAVLAEIDGERNVEQLSSDLNMHMNTMRDVLSRLAEKGLISEVEQKVPLLSPKTLEAMKQYLVKAVGPMGEVLFDDIADELGLDSAEIPVNRASELIESLAEEIPDDATKQTFKNRLLQLVRSG
jgi:predicted ArsR family transcriptional regulator